MVTFTIYSFFLPRALGSRVHVIDFFTVCFLSVTQPKDISSSILRYELFTFYIVHVKMSIWIIVTAAVHFIIWNSYEQTILKTYAFNSIVTSIYRKTMKNVDGYFSCNEMKWKQIEVCFCPYSWFIAFTFARVRTAAFVFIGFMQKKRKNEMNTCYTGQFQLIGWH